MVSERWQSRRYQPLSLPLHKKTTDSYTEMKISLDGLKCLIKSLQQHSGKKKWRITTQKGLLGKSAWQRHLKRAKNKETGQRLSVSALQQMPMQSPLACSVEDPGKFCF